MRTLVSFSGGKDSLAAMLYTYNNITKNFTAVFCDTGWEHPLTYAHITEVCEKLEVELMILKNKNFEGFIDMAAKKTRFPSSQRRFCTVELKANPMIDYILELNQDVLIIQGIRSDESLSRSRMSAQCTYFKYYRTPTKVVNGKQYFHKYRKKEVIAFVEQYADDILRPVFTWTSQQIIDYIVSCGFQPNPLYKMGMKRVGCFPCIMSNHTDIYSISKYFPETFERIAEAEERIGSSFFSPDKIPAWAYNGKFPHVMDVVNYVKGKNATGDLFDPDGDISCSSFYHLCE